MKIAILGWGSLIWNPETISVNNDWVFEGPHLPIEFARVSNNGRLTLVINLNSTKCKVFYNISSFSNLDEAIYNLSHREGCNLNRINFINFSTNENNLKEKQKIIYDSICEWNKSNNFDAVIWTGLTPKFYDDGHGKLNLDNIKKYLTSLNDDQFELAKEYILKTPEQIETEYKRELQDFVKKKAHQINDEPLSKLERKSYL